MNNSSGIKSNSYMIHINDMFSLCIYKINEVNEYQKINQYLTEEEKKYTENLKFEKRLYSYLIGRYTAKRAIADFCNIGSLDSIEIKQGVFYQPYISSKGLNDVDISLTHCNHIGGAVAFSKSIMMGIDIEQVLTKNIEVISTQCSKSEILMIKNIFKKEEVGLTINWCLKEAMSKAIKTGFAASIDMFEIKKIEQYEQCYIAEYEKFGQYRSIAVNFDEYICAITIPKEIMSDEIICMMRKIQSSL